MGKPKKNAKTALSAEKTVTRKLRGQKVLYIGYMTDGKTCPTCRANKKYGMLSLYEGIFYCSEGCIPN